MAKRVAAAEFGSVTASPWVWRAPTGQRLGLLNLGPEHLQTQHGGLPVLPVLLPPRVELAQVLARPLLDHVRLGRAQPGLGQGQLHRHHHPQPLPLPLVHFSKPLSAAPCQLLVRAGQAQERALLAHHRRSGAQQLRHLVPSPFRRNV